MIRWHAGLLVKDGNDIKQSIRNARERSIMALTEKDRNDRVDQIMAAVDHLFTARLAVENIAQRPDGPDAPTQAEVDAAEAELDEAKAELRRVLLYAVR
jgi:hypothetical protein